MGLGQAISFGSEITGDLARAEEREWLITNGLGSYGSGTVAGTRTRAYHGLLVAALRAPADPCERTLLVAALEEEVEVGGRSVPLGHAWMVSFALEGTVPTWRYALGDALLEKRLWMQSGAHTTTVLYRLLQASQPVQLSLTALVNSRSHHGGIPRPESPFKPYPMACGWSPRQRALRPLWCSVIGAAPRWPLRESGAGALPCRRRRSGVCPAGTTICGPPGSGCA